MELKNKLQMIEEGFKSLSVDDSFKQASLKNIELWLSEEVFQEYVPQINYLVEVENWDLLLDCFYQLIPFGTAGRRGEVGIGPNRINIWTLQAAAQGHSQYLIKKFGEDAKTRGVIIAYDVRAYLKETDYDSNRSNPIAGLDCKTLALRLAEVYAGNNIKVMMFNGITSTPELSFMIRHKKAIASNMVSASHNPPEYNGQKVMDEHGGQLIPPFDEELINEVVDNVSEIKSVEFEEAVEKELVVYLEDKDHQAYLDAAAEVSLNDKYRSIKALFSSYHGTTITSTLPVLKALNFNVTLDEKSGSPDPRFSSIMFNIPNPEVEESFINLVPSAEKIDADIIITADPDGDRFGLMSKEVDGWRFFSGNEFFVLSLSYMLDELKKQGKLKPNMVIMKTVVTTGILEVIGEQNELQTIPDLLVGYKYVADKMNKLEEQGRIDDFIMAGEESHGMNTGDYIREKDATVPSILICELASKLKDEGKTLGMYLDEIYMQFGYFKNYVTEIRLPGAEGMSKMAHIMKEIRENTPEGFDKYKVKSFVDRWEGEPFVSESDKVSRNVLIFQMEGDEYTRGIRLIARPSGTEPKMKFYFEVGRKPVNNLEELAQEKKIADEIKDELEKLVLTYAYKIIGIDFPERGFLLFWQLPAQVKMKYFEIESDIEALVEVEDNKEREEKLYKLLIFLGADPIEKVDKAFIAKNGKGVLDYLGLN